MRLPDGPRQILAALVAAGAFLGLYFGLSLVWWLALGLAVVVYGALLLVIGRRTPADEIMLGARVSAADLANASAALSQSAARLSNAAERAPEADRAEIEAMAGHLRSIRDKVASDPEDFRNTRRFLTSYLPHLVTTVEGYADLARQAKGSNAERLAAIRQNITEFGPVLERIDQACLENDFAALEVQVDVLATQMKRG